MLIAGILGSLGLIAILCRRTFLGVLVGFQLVAWSGAVAVVFSGESAQRGSAGEVFAVIILLASLAVFILGLAVSVRFSHLLSREKKEMQPGGIQLEEMRELKN